MLQQLNCAPGVTTGSRYKPKYPDLGMNKVLFVQITVTAVQHTRLTVVSAPKGPNGASVFGQGDGVRATAGHLAYIADVLHEHGDVAAVAVTVS